MGISPFKSKLNPYFFPFQYEPQYEKDLFMPYVNNKGADQPAHPRSLINTFIVHCLDGISILDTPKFQDPS